MRKPTPSQISRVMSELGRRNKGKSKKLTPAGIAQRRKAGMASARLRKADAILRRKINAQMDDFKASPSPATPRGTPPKTLHH